jgi:hypothetical protein
VFTEPLLRNGLDIPIVPLLLGADDIENTASSIGACWSVFTELLPGNALIKSATVLSVNWLSRWLILGKTNIIIYVNNVENRLIAA